MERKIFWKLNIIDILLIAVVVLSLFALIYKLTHGNNDDLSAYLFTFVCDSAPIEVYDGIEAGTACSDGDAGVALGNLTRLVLSDIAGDDSHKQGIFTVGLNGIQGEHGVTVDDILYLKGKCLNLIAGDSVFSVYLSDMQLLE